MVTPAMSFFLHKGLCEQAYVKESFQLFRERFDRMLAPGTSQTLWEEWFLDGTGRSGRFQYKTRSDAQTESAFPPALIAEYVFGLRVLSPGMRKVSLSRIYSGVKQASGSFPTPFGDLEVSWENQSKGGGLQLTIPEGMELMLDLESLESRRDKILVNGQAFVLGNGKNKYHNLSSGRHTIGY